MSKLSKREVEVMVKEVMNGIKVLEQNQSEELFNNSVNKESFLNKVTEMKDLGDKMEKLEDELRELRELSWNKKNELENLFKEEGIKVDYLGSGNLESKKIGKPFKITLQNAKGGDWSLRCKIEDELILQGINNKIDVNTIINELIEKHK